MKWIIATIICLLITSKSAFVKKDCTDECEQYCWDYFEYLLQEDPLHSTCALTYDAFDGASQYSTKFQFNNDFYNDDQCTNIKVYLNEQEFEGAQITEDSIQLIIEYEKLEELGCDDDETTADEFVWQCVPKIEIYDSDGELQHTQFSIIQIRINKNAADEVDFTVVSTIDHDICCVLDDKIKTDLVICTDASCDVTLTDETAVPYTRGDTVYFMQFIDQLGSFKNYYLTNLDVQIHYSGYSIVPNFKDNFIYYMPGRTLFSCRMNKSVAGMSLSAITQISSTAPAVTEVDPDVDYGDRRILEEEIDIETDPSLKGEMFFTFDETEQDPAVIESQTDNTILILGLGIMGVIIVGILVMGFVCYRRPKHNAQLQANPQSKYIVKETADENAF